MTHTAPPNDPAAALWAVLSDFVVQAFSLFGAPYAIAQRGVALRSEHAMLLLWLRQCETLLCKLLFLDALALVAAPRTAAFQPAKVSPRVAPTSKTRRIQRRGA